MSRLEAATAAAILLVPLASAAVVPAAPAAGAGGPSAPAEAPPGQVSTPPARLGQAWAAAGEPGARSRISAATAALRLARAAGRAGAGGPSLAPSTRAPGAGADGALQGVPRILDAASPPPTTLEGAVQLRSQVAGGDEPATLPDAPRFGSLPAALLALLAWHGETPTPEQARRVAAMGELPDDVEAGLARIVEAHLLQAKVQVSVHPRGAPLTSATSGFPAGDGTGSVDADGRRTLVLARDAVTRRVRAALDLLHPVEKGPARSLRIPGVISIETSAAPSTYTTDYRLQVDLGGDDDYLNNAGGANLGAATLVDTLGDDEYRGWGSQGLVANGGGAIGFGFLLDARGADRYAATHTASGDVYRVANGGGAGAGGTGALVDLGGNDGFWANLTAAGGFLQAAVNGGSYHEGTGSLVDLGGDDTYAADLAGESVEAGVNAGVHSGGTASVGGFLFEAAGDDTYEAEVAATASGDFDDTSVALNGGAVVGASLLVDATGSDDYALNVSDPDGVTVAGQGGGTAGGTGVLADGAGGDNYTSVARSTADTVAAGAAGGGVLGGAGILLDRLGDDNYTARGPGTTQGSGNLGGVGLLADGGGENTYESASQNVGGAVAQGTGVLGGVGLLVDRGTNATFDLGAGVTGQGSGLQGLGLLYHADADGEARFDTASPSQALTLRGGGTGLVVSVGNITGPDPPTLGCDGYLGGGPQTQAGATLHLCDPRDADKRPIVDPRDGEPLTVRNPATGQGEEGAIWKPTCTWALGSPATCETILAPVGQHADEGAEDWLQDSTVNSTTQGALGFLHEGGPGGVKSVKGSELLYGPTMADQACKFSCWAAAR